MIDSRKQYRAPRRSRLVGALRFLRMKWGHFIRRSPHPAPVGRPDFYRRELTSSLFVRSSSGLPVREFVSPDHLERDVYDVARECFTRYGVYPVNFSFPRADLLPQSIEERPHFLSTTIPGEPFSFTDWESYLEEYRSSYFALSTKKGGWDTFRHLEILFSGTIPLMPRLRASSPFSLAHFPKRALVEVLRSLEHDGLALPGPRTREFFRDFSLAHLTTEASAHYLRTLAGLEGKRILFLDQSLPHRTDYLSAFVLIGLLRTGEVDIAYEPSYLFDDYRGDTATLYGRGFGYSRSVPASMRDPQSLSAESSIADLTQRCEAAEVIVVGSYDNNRSVVEELVRRGIPEERFVCVVGSDLTADFALFSHMRSSGMMFFVREFA